MKTLKLSLLLLTVSFFTACQKSSDKDSAPGGLIGLLLPLKAEVLISEVSTDQCFNLEKLLTRIQDPQFAFPAATMNTNLKSLNSMPLSKNQFFSYASFYYKVGKANDLNLFTTAKQTDCSTIELATASNDVLTYQITVHSDRHLAFKLTDKVPVGTREFQKKALAEKLQPYEYVVSYISKNQLNIVEKYKTVDPLCAGKGQKPLKFEVTKQINWADSEAALPRQYSVSSGYLDLVRKSLSAVNPAPALPEQPELPFEDPIIGPQTGDSTGEATVVSLEEIYRIMSTPIRNELKVCSQ